jgi:hypothetical protein
MVVIVVVIAERDTSFTFGTERETSFTFAQV